MGKACEGGGPFPVELLRHSFSLQIPACFYPVPNRPEPYKEYQYTAIDDCTRLRFIWVYQELYPANSVDFTRRTLKFFPFPVEEVPTDHGMEFTYIFMPWVKKPHPFEEFLKEMGIRYKPIPIATPKQNGQVDIAHRTGDEEFYKQRGFRKPAKRTRELSRFLDFC